VLSDKRLLALKKRRIVFSTTIALLCGLAVLASLVLTIVLLSNAQDATYHVQYDLLAGADWLGLLALVTVPLAALLLVFLPLHHWLGTLRTRRGLTYTLLWLVPLLGAVPLAVWVAAGSLGEATTHLFNQGFVVPILLFALSWGITIAQIISRRR
jgi:hypothetical protein